jgi:hypothetical protein
MVKSVKVLSIGSETLVCSGLEERRVPRFVHQLADRHCKQVEPTSGTAGSLSSGVSTDRAGLSLCTLFDVTVARLIDAEEIMERARDEVRTICDKGLADLLPFAHEVLLTQRQAGNARRSAHRESSDHRLTPGASSVTILTAKTLDLFQA